MYSGVPRSGTTRPVPLCNRSTIIRNKNACFFHPNPDVIDSLCAFALFCGCLFRQGEWSLSVNRLARSTEILVTVETS